MGDARPGHELSRLGGGHQGCETPALNAGTGGMGLRVQSGGEAWDEAGRDGLETVFSSEPSLLCQVARYAYVFALFGF